MTSIRTTRSITRATELKNRRASAPALETEQVIRRAVKRRRIEQPLTLTDPPPRTRPRKSGNTPSNTPVNVAAQDSGKETFALHRPSDIDDAMPASPLDRPAEPHTTNAPLKTPRGSRVIAYSRETLNSSPSKIGIPRPTTTTANLLEEAKAHLISVDPSLRPLVEKHHCEVFSPAGLEEEVDPFRSLCTGIMAQQVSGAAASAIKKRFIGLFDRSVDMEKGESARFPTPEQVASTDLATLRSAGLSGRKAEYIQGLAEKFVTGELSARLLVEAPYEEVLEKLTAVRGLGKWSVEMFACFALKRMDVLSTGDLGVQRGMAAYMGKDVKKLKAKGGTNKWKYMSEQDMLKNSEKFAPYRSLFMWYMWRIEDTDVEALQNG